MNIIATVCFRRVRFAGLLLMGGLLFAGMGQTSRATDLSGNWTGCWKSCTSGHHGPLNATFSKIDECHYCVQFRGRFFKVLPFRYTVTLTVTGQEGNKVLLSGTSYLGRLFGTFTYSAEATATDFMATYSSCSDHGIFVLRRCCTCPKCLDH